MVKIIDTSNPIDKGFDKLGDLLSAVSHRDPPNALARQRAIGRMSNEQARHYAKAAQRQLELLHAFYMQRT